MFTNLIYFYAVLENLYFYVNFPTLLYFKLKFKVSFLVEYFPVQLFFLVFKIAIFLIWKKEFAIFVRNLEKFAPILRNFVNLLCLNVILQIYSIFTYF